MEKLYSGDQDGAVAQDMKNLDTTGGAWRGRVRFIGADLIWGNRFVERMKCLIKTQSIAVS